MLSWRYGQAASAVAVLSLTESELTKTESTYLAEMHRQSPKEKASKPPTVRRRKRPHAHLRVPHLEEVMSPVTTPTDEDVGHRIKHVAGVCRRGRVVWLRAWGWAACLCLAHSGTFILYLGYRLCIIYTKLIKSKAPDARPVSICPLSSSASAEPICVLG